MSFLPIVTRELRVAARRRLTYWSRVGAASAVLLIYSAILLIAHLSQAATSGQIGPWLFNLFSWLALVFTAAAGVFFTSDALSEEKREGTLGLLFLTDLRGYDVVLGKLLAHSLRGTYGLLAAFPVFGMSILLGGVSGFEFWRLVLVLLNALFFSLAAGVFVSSLAREAQRALSGTLLAIVIFFGVLPLIDWAASGWDMTRFQARFSLASPGYAFTQFRGGRFSDYWSAMALTQAVAWLMLAAACFIVPRRWQDKIAGPARRRWWQRLGAPAKRAAWRTRLLEANPVRWLAARDPWMVRTVVLTLLALAALYGALFFVFENMDAYRTVGQVLHWLLKAIVVIWLASQATRFFVDAARTGMLELMLATPMTPRQIVHGQWWALLRTFLGPAVVLFGIEIVIDGAVLLDAYKRASNAPAAAGTAGYNFYLVQTAVASVLSLLNFPAKLLATAWFGMWMGLTTRKPNPAVLKTLLFVSVLPWFIGYFILMFTFALFGFVLRGTGGPMWMWLPMLGHGLFLLAANAGFFLLARHRLLVKFRRTFARASGLGQGTSPTPPPLAAGSAIARPST